MMTDGDLICFYIRDQLPEPEKSKFEKRLNDEPELLKEYIFQKELREAVLDDEVMELREQLREIGDNSRLQRKVFNKMRVGGMAMVSVFLAVILFLSVIYQQDNNASSKPDKLFREYYQPYKSIVSVRSEANTNNKLIKEAFKYYSLGKWKQSKECLDTLISKEPDNTMFRLYIGIVELEMGNARTSIHHFNETIDINNPMFTRQAYWYSAMAYIKAGQMDKAEERLEWIVQEEGYRYKEAGDILKEIEDDIFSW